MSSTWQHERGRVASLTRSRPPDDPELIEARRNLRAARASEYVQQLVASSPPLTQEQRSHLAALLLQEPAGEP